MGCVASKLEAEEAVVSICRERKHQLKLAVERRHALADAHTKYCRALCGVSAAIKLFVACHSSPSPPFFITFPPPRQPSPPKENEASDTLLLQQTPREQTREAIGCTSCDSSTSSDSSEEEREEKVEIEEEQACGYFYMEMPQQMPSPHGDFGWDFFNPFVAVRPEIMGGYHRNSDDDFRVVREEEGIPDLEEEGIPDLEEEGDRMEEESHVVVGGEETENVESEDSGVGVGLVRVVDNGTYVSQGEQKGLTVMDTPVKGRELLEALKDIEDHFIRAYDSGKDVSRMLEANMVHLQSSLEEIKENSTKLIQAISWRSTSSCKSLVVSSSKSSSTWTEFRNDHFDNYGGMDSGSHSLTLERLNAWEKKLYAEVKVNFYQPPSSYDYFPLLLSCNFWM